MRDLSPVMSHIHHVVSFSIDATAGSESKGSHASRGKSLVEDPAYERGRLETTPVILEALKSGGFADFERVIQWSSTGRSFEFGRSESPNASLDGSIDEVELRITTYGRDHRVDPSESIAESRRVVVVDLQHLKPSGDKFRLGLRSCVSKSLLHGTRARDG